MKKILLVTFSLLLAVVMVQPAFAGAKNATYIEWSWNNPNTPGGAAKSAYFQTTGSGLVNAWTYDHPDLDDARFVIKPLSKFKNADSCDEGWLRENPNWTPRGIYNSADGDNKVKIMEIFGDLDAKYLFCAYQME